MNEPAFSLQEVSKRYVNRDGGPVVALQNFSLEAERGHVTCLLGSTGCGKTTLLRIAAGLEAADSGSVHVAGQSPEMHRGQLGYLTQEPSLMPWQRLIDNVALPLRAQGLPRAESLPLAQQHLGRVGLRDAARRFPHECSGGMRQRAMLARLIATHASFWLLDEPFRALDERTRFSLQQLLLELREEAALSLLLVTHDLEEAVFLADRIAVMTPEPGRLQTVHEVNLAHPRDRLSEPFARHIESLRRQLDAMVLEPPAPLPPV